MTNMYELCRLAGSKLILPKCAETEYEWGEDWFRIYITYGRNARHQYTFRAKKNNIPVETQVMNWVKKKF